jgi:DNA-binding beta-propeller fold protein YncE
VNVRRTRRIAAAAIAAALMFALVPSTALADTGTTPALVRTLGGPSHAEMYPSGLEVAPNGDLVVANTGDNAVMRYSASGTQLWRIGSHGTGTGQFFNPRDVAVDSQGRVYVADTRNSRIVRLTANGQWDITFAGPTNDRISWPMGITISDDVVYVADAGKNKARAFTLDGQPVTGVGTTGTGIWTSTGACQFPDLRDVDADDDGNIYIANYKGSNVAVLGPGGACLRTFGSNGTAGNQFKTPYGIRLANDPVTNEELVYVADGNNNQVKAWTKAGTFVGAFGATGQPPADGTFAELRRVAVAADGDVWAADLWGWRIERFNRTATGWTYAQMIGDPLPAPTASAVFHEAQQVAFDAAGMAWIVDRVHHRLVQMNPSTGAIIKTCGRRGSANGQFNWPQGVAIDPATGYLWVANTKQYNIHIVNPTNCNGIGRMGTFGTGLANLNWPYAIVIRGSDRIAFLPDNQNDRIVAYSVANKAAIGAFGTLGSGVGQFNEPGGIGLDPSNGHVYVADTKNDRIVELASANGTSFSWVRTIDGFDDPGGVAVDGQGRIAVADTLNHRVVLLNPNGTQLGIITNPTMDDPESVSFGPDGRLYVSDTYNDRVLVYESMGGGGPGPDTAAPNGNLTSPAKDQVVTSPVTFTGAATDNVGVTQVRIAVQDRVSKQWYRSTNSWGAFQAQLATLASPGGTSTTWSYQWTPPAGGSGQYAVQVNAVDAAGNQDPTKPYVAFTVSSGGGSDTIAPNGTVSVPLNNQTLNGIPAQLSGTATDNVGVTEVRIAIRDRTTGQWLRVGGWGAFMNHAANLSSAGATTTNWTYSFSPPLGGSGNYALQVTAVDGANNVDPTKPWVAFQLNP